MLIALSGDLDVPISTRLYETFSHSLRLQPRYLWKEASICCSPVAALTAVYRKVSTDVSVQSFHSKQAGLLFPVCSSQLIFFLSSSSVLD